MSEFALTRDGWVQTLNFFAGGGLLVAFAAGLLHAGPDRSVSMAIAIGLVGIGLVVAGAYPVGIERAGGALLVFAGLAASCVMLGVMQAMRRRIANAAAGFAAALVVIVFFEISGADWFGGTYVGTASGLTQRVWLITGFGAIAAYAISALRRDVVR